MIIEFSDSDIKQSTVVEPAWYVVHIDEVEDRQANDGQSTNTWLKGHIVRNADTGDTKFANVPTPFLWLFNSKGAWAAVGFCAALGMEPGAGKRADLSQSQGKDIEVFISNGLYKGVMGNVISNQYRPVRNQ